MFYYNDVVSKAMHFPTFPDFRRVGQSDRYLYEPFYERCDPYSDFSFNNLLTWLDFNDDLCISQHGHNIILRFSNIFDDNRESYTILGVDDCVSTARVVLAFMESTDVASPLTILPDSAVAKNFADILPSDLTANIDPASMDYVYDIRDFLNMQGSGYARLRNELSAVERTYTNRISVQFLDLTEAATKGLILASLQKWSIHKEFDRNDPNQTEFKAIDRYFTLTDARTQCLGVFIDNNLVSFSFFHLPPQHGWAILNHLKADRNYKFIFDYTFYAVLRHLADESIWRLNFEQDLGIEGLRFHKQQMRPSGHVYRYIIRKTNQS